MTAARVHPFGSRVACLLAALLCALPCAVAAAPLSLVGGEMPVPRDTMSPASNARLRAETAANVARLQAQGRLSFAKGLIEAQFQWPVKLTDGHPDRGADGLTNYVDEDPAYPGHVRDYNCGTRSYDLPDGYNHSGTDIATWPFPWRKMAQGEVVVVAAAPGTIVNRKDGAFDQSCAMNDELPNLVVVRHDDGSTAEYLHLKRGSVTAKGIGDPVAVGEYLGIVGSSGSSTGPHLHFEIYDDAHALVDPFAGACNGRGLPSRWVLQQPYYDSQVIHLGTADAAPEFPACPGIENPHAQQYFVPGQVVHAVGYFRDLRSGDALTFVVNRPDGSRFLATPIDTAATMGAPVYTFGYYDQPFTLPADAPTGEWTFEIVYAGAVERTGFFVGGAEPPRVTVVEYYAAALDHYFITAFPEEQAALDRGVPVAGWVRTGVTFPAYAGPGPRGIAPACRFFGTPGLGVNSHFYTVSPAECAAVKQNPGWTFEANAFHLPAPTAGMCPDGTRPLYRMYNNGMRGSPNHRYVTDLALASTMTAAGWLLEGAAMCLPQ